jgi:SAM-dependent methyltransferase/RimJ/RimL family protein N-acetyltransferase
MFDDDYLHFYAEILGAERSEHDAELISSVLSLTSGMRVLDAPCGEGRISGRLAQRGCEVVGVDATERFVALAREQYPTVTFDVGDLRSLPYEAEFDAIVNWFTSFGYFDPDTNDRVLEGFARALRPGGRLLLELHNPWRLMRLLEVGGGASASVTTRGSGVMVDRVTYDEATRRSRTERFIVRDGRARELEFSLEQVPAPQLARRLRRSGFATVRLLGDDGSPFDPDSRRLIAVAQKRGGGGSIEPPRLSLREVDATNVRAVCDLKLAPGQRTYVAPSAYTIAESQFYPDAWVRAIYAGDEPVGVLAMDADTRTPRYMLVRLMIAAQHQDRGFGRAALERVVEHVRTLPEASELETSCVPGPAGPIGFYRAFGFEETGRVEHGETLLRLEL